MNGTRPERETDNRSDNPLTPSEQKPSDNSQLATWRSGYAADCKSGENQHENKPLSKNRYQDSSRTGCEPDNHSSDPPETRNPGTLAGVTGADDESRAARSRQSTIRLPAAIPDRHRRFLSAVAAELFLMRRGAPDVPALAIVMAARLGVIELTALRDAVLMALAYHGRRDVTPCGKFERVPGTSDHWRLRALR